MIISVIFLAGLDIFTPLLNSRIIKVFFSENPQYEKTWLYISLYVLCALAYAIVIYTFINMAGKVEVEVADELRQEAFLKLQELPFSYYDKTAAGWIMARLTSDSRKLAEIISWGFVNLGYVKDTGFAYPITVQDNTLHEYLDIVLHDLPDWM